MTYAIKISRKAQKLLAKIQNNFQQDIIIAIRGLAINPRPEGCKKLSGRDAWRIRIGHTGCCMKSMLVSYASWSLQLLTVVRFTEVTPELVEGGERIAPNELHKAYHPLDIPSCIYSLASKRRMGRL